jgi:hypothetical protein
MGWANCGKDSRGRPIGYAAQGRCDHQECQVAIDRGLSYACGDMHGQNEHDCEGYFCSTHLTYRKVDGRNIQLCFACAKHVGDDEEEAAEIGRRR